MSSTTHVITIGNVLRADIRGFVVASRIPEPEVPTFGTFVRAPIQHNQAQLIGLVYDIRLQDDPFLRNLAVTVRPDDPAFHEIIQDQRENRVIPVEISVAAVAYHYVDDLQCRYGLPPQPPMILHQITVCARDEVARITRSPDFMRALLDNRDIPADELIPTALLRAAPLHTGAEYDFLLNAGRYLARNLGRDPARLERILQRIAIA
jgi:hypothetical protein